MRSCSASGAASKLVAASKKPAPIANLRPSGSNGSPQRLDPSAVAGVQRRRIQCLSTRSTPRSRSRARRAAANRRRFRAANGAPADGAAIRGRRRRRRRRQLLQSLMHFVRAELAPLGDDERSSSPDNPQLLLERLDVFRRAFAHFIAAFGSYARRLRPRGSCADGVRGRPAPARRRGRRRAELRRRLSTSQQDTAQLLLEQRREPAQRRGRRASLQEREAARVRQ